MVPASSGFMEVLVWGKQSFGKLSWRLTNMIYGPLLIT